MNLEVSEFDKKLNILKELIELREPAKSIFDQKYITINSILHKLEILQKTNMLDSRRILVIGDSDLSAVSIAIFGNPTDVLIADIDKRLTDLLFDANMDYDLPVRFVYHDMRLKIIEILQNQFSLIILEPPRSKAGIEVFLSRAVSCLESGYEDSIFITIPSSGEIYDFCKNYFKENRFEILQEYKGIIKYNGKFDSGTFMQLKVEAKVSPSHAPHWILPFFENEENQIVKIFRCKCNKLHKVGPDLKELSELQINGCECGHKDIFVYNSDVPLI